MYIDVVLDKVIWTVNWLHDLNYEPIARTSSARNLVRTMNVLCQNFLSYGWCNNIPRVIPLFILFLEKLCMTIFLTEGKRVFHVSIFSLAQSGNGYASGCLYDVHAYTYQPCNTYYVTVLVFSCPSVRTALSRTVKIFLLYL